jgi:hypothetical protein
MNVVVFLLLLLTHCYHPSNVSTTIKAQLLQLRDDELITVTALGALAAILPCGIKQGIRLIVSWSVPLHRRKRPILCLTGILRPLTLVVTIAKLPKPSNDMSAAKIAASLSDVEVGNILVTYTNNPRVEAKCGCVRTFQAMVARLALT